MNIIHATHWNITVAIIHLAFLSLSAFLLHFYVK